MADSTNSNIADPLQAALNNVVDEFVQIELQRRQFGNRYTKKQAPNEPINDFQKSLVPFVRTMIKRTTNGFTYSGKENLSSKPTLFIGNHRDIALDALFLNYARYLEGFKTVRIAIGDNLLDGRFFEKLMRLNKSFVVYRNIKGIKA